MMSQRCGRLPLLGPSPTKEARSWAEKPPTQHFQQAYRGLEARAAQTLILLPRNGVGRVVCQGPSRRYVS